MTTQATKVVSATAKGSLAVGVAGAIVAGASVAAKNIRKVKGGGMTKNEAVRDTAKEAGATGLAAGTAAAVVGAVGLGGFVGLIGIAALATGAKYLLDSALENTPRKEPAKAKTKKPPRA